MDVLIETTAMVVLFILRMGIPIAVTVAIVSGLKFLDGRWQADAEARHASRAVAQGLLTPDAVSSPMAAEKPCWELNGCTEEKRKQCSGCAMTDIPCWMARLRADGKLPARCYGCALFRTRQTLQPVPVRA